MGTGRRLCGKMMGRGSGKRETWRMGKETNMGSAMGLGDRLMGLGMMKGKRLWKREREREMRMGRGIGRLVRIPLGLGMDWGRQSRIQILGGWIGMLEREPG